MKAKTNKFITTATGLCFPIISFIYALFHPKTEHLKLTIILFFTFVGLAFYYQGDSADVTKYVSDFEQATSMKGIGPVDYFLSRPDLQQIDYYTAFMIWSISRITNDSRIFLGVLAFVFAFFFSTNIKYVVDKISDNKINILLLIVLICLPKVMFLTHRWWAALQVFLFGLLPVVFEKKYVRLIWCFIATSVIHFSFLYPFGILIASILLPKRVYLPYLLFFVSAIFIDSFDFSVFTPLANIYLPEMIADRTESYINIELQNHNFFSQSARIVMNIANVIIMLSIYLTNKKSLKKNETLSTLYVMSLIFGSFSSIASLTEWGWRYLDLSNSLFVVFYLIYLSDIENYKRSIVLFRWCSPFFVYFILFQIRGFFAIIGPNQLFFGNYFTTWFLNDSHSVLDIINP